MKKEILELPFESLLFERMRKRILLEQNDMCNNCGLSEWMSQKLTLEIDHIDGNNKNNERKNLEAICPNCHSLTNTWRGRNKKDRNSKISDEKIIEAFLETGNIRQTLLKVELAAKGSNYGRVKRALTLNGIRYKLNGKIINTDDTC